MFVCLVLVFVFGFPLLLVWFGLVLDLLVCFWFVFGFFCVFGGGGGFFLSLLFFKQLSDHLCLTLFFHSG